MKSHRKVLTLNVPSRIGFVNITPEVEAAVRESGVKEGLCLVNPMHITASVFVNDDEGGLRGLRALFRNARPARARAAMAAQRCR